MCEIKYSLETFVCLYNHKYPGGVSLLPEQLINHYHFVRGADLWHYQSSWRNIGSWACSKVLDA